MYIIGWLYRDNGKENGNYRVIEVYIIGLYIGIMEKKMETTIQGLGYSPPSIDRI